MSLTPPSFILLVGGGRGWLPIDEASVYVCAPPPHTLPLTSPFCHTHPSLIPPSTPSGALYHDVVSFIKRGPVFTFMWDDHVAL